MRSSISQVQVPSEFKHATPFPACRAASQFSSYFLATIQRVACTRKGDRVGVLSVLRFIPIGVFDDATVRGIGKAVQTDNRDRAKGERNVTRLPFDAACKELNDTGPPAVAHEVM